jgi:hypothetical protein
MLLRKSEMEHSQATPLLKYAVLSAFELLTNHNRSASVLVELQFRTSSKIVLTAILRETFVLSEQAYLWQRLVLHGEHFSLNFLLPFYIKIAPGQPRLLKEGVNTEGLL